MTKNVLFTVQRHQIQHKNNWSSFTGENAHIGHKSKRKTSYQLEPRRVWQLETAFFQHTAATEGSQTAKRTKKRNQLHNCRTELRTEIMQQKLHNCGQKRLIFVTKESYFMYNSIITEGCPSLIFRIQQMTKTSSLLLIPQILLPVQFNSFHREF